jgi:hypothetical protein
MKEFDELESWMLGRMFRARKVALGGGASCGSKSTPPYLSKRPIM